MPWSFTASSMSGLAKLSKCTIVPSLWGTEGTKHLTPYKNFIPNFSNSGLRYASMKSTLAALIAISLIGCGGGIKTSNSSTPSISPQSGVVFVGDSIFGKLVANDAFKQHGFINAGVFGWRTDQLLAVFPDVLSGKNICHGFIAPPDFTGPNPFPFECVSLPQPPKTIVLMAGWNNFFQGNPANVLSDLQSMVVMAQNQNTKVVICTIYAFDPGHPAPWMVPTGDQPVTFYDPWRNPVNDGLLAMKHMQGMTVVDLSAVFSGESGYTADGVHPTDDGNTQMLSAILSKL